MGKSGNPAKRAAQQRQQQRRRPAPMLMEVPNMIEVGADPDQGLVLLNVRGQITGMTPETVDDLVTSLANASAHVRSHKG